MDRNRPQPGFVVRVDAGEGTTRFCVLRRPAAIETLDCRSLREALTAHRDDLLERLTAVRALLASDRPERADRAFAAAPDIEITEIVLAASPEPDRFGELMRRAFEDSAGHET